MGKKIKHLDFTGLWKSDNSKKHRQDGTFLCNDDFNEQTMLSIVKAKLLNLRKNKTNLKLRQFPNKGNGFDV